MVVPAVAKGNRASAVRRRGEDDPERSERDGYRSGYDRDAS